MLRFGDAFYKNLKRSKKYFISIHKIRAGWIRIQKAYTFLLLCISKYCRNTQIGCVIPNDVSFLNERVRMKESASGPMGPASWLRGHGAHFAMDGAATGPPRLINTVESTKVNCAKIPFNGSDQRRWRMNKLVMANFRSKSLIHFGWLTTDYPYQQASHDLFPSVERVERLFFPLYFFFLKCVDIPSSQQQLPAQVHLPPFSNRLSRSPFVELCKQYRSTVEFNFVDSTALINLGGPV